MNYGTFTKSTRDFKQANSSDLDLFVAQLVSDAVKTSTIATIAGSYVSPFYLFPSAQELKSKSMNTDCIITIAHDQDTQAIYPDNSLRHHKVLSQWDRPYVINATIEDKETNQNNSQLIYKIQDELIDLLCFNNGEYTNSGSLTETYANRPLRNQLLESRVFHENTTNRVNHYYISLTILFRIYKNN